MTPSYAMRWTNATGWEKRSFEPAKLLSRISRDAFFTPVFHPKARSKRC